MAIGISEGLDSIHVITVLLEGFSLHIFRLYAHTLSTKISLAGPQQKVQVGMWVHQRLRSACGYTQSDQSLQWALFG